LDSRLGMEYMWDMKGSRLPSKYFPALKRVFISRDVTFMETLIRPVAQYPDESSITEVSNGGDESESSSDKEAGTSTSTSDFEDENENGTHQERSITDSRPKRERQNLKGIRTTAC